MAEYAEWGFPGDGGNVGEDGLVRLVAWREGLRGGEASEEPREGGGVFRMEWKVAAGRQDAGELEEEILSGKKAGDQE